MTNQICFFLHFGVTKQRGHQNISFSVRLCKDTFGLILVFLKTVLFTCRQCSLWKSYITLSKCFCTARTVAQPCTHFNNEAFQALKGVCGIHTILNLECCKCARIRFHCANGLVVLRVCSPKREHCLTVAFGNTFYWLAYPGAKWCLPYCHFQEVHTPNSSPTTGMKPGLGLPLRLHQ